MKLYIHATDGDWFKFLHARAPLDEVNFWKPSGTSVFRALDENELFLFKLHSPQNFIVGGGLFAFSRLFPLSVAWDAFGEKNGVPSLTDLREAVARYRSVAPQHEDFTIGCIVLRAPFFFDRSDWISVPSATLRGIPAGKSLLLSDPFARWLRAEVETRIRGISFEPIASAIAEAPDRMFGSPIVVTPRLGQGEFRLRVTDIYRRRCAISQERALPTLEAAHVLPVTDGGTHRIDNGLLLRSDIHRLFDRGYITIAPDYRVEVSRRLKTDFDNGEPYYPFHGMRIQLPRDPAARPNREFLDWHRSRFLT